MRDLSIIEEGRDLELANTVLPKAVNVISIQLGDLEYAPNFGSDKRYFLEQPAFFQNESFKAYLVKRLTEHGINVSSVGEMIHSLFAEYQFNIPEIPYAPDFSNREILSNVLLDADGSYLTDSDGAPLLDGLF